MNSQHLESDSRIGSPLPSAWKAQLGLALTMMIAFPATAAFGWHRLGSNGLICAAVASILCWLSGGIAIAIVARSQKSPNHAVTGVLLGTLVRLALPLVSLVLASAVIPGEVGRCFGGLVLANYLLGLAVETVLLTKLVKVAPSVAKVS